MQTLGYYNGTIGEIAEMTVPMNDRAAYFGDGVYDAAYAHNHKIYCLDAHLDRFFHSMELVRIAPPVERDALAALLRELSGKVGDGDQFVYWQATRGTAPRNHAFPAGPSNLWVTIEPRAVQDTYRRLKLITVEDTRFLHCNIKTLNLLPNVLAAQRATEAGADEAVFHRGETVTECAHSNIHLLKDGTLRTHPTDCHILPGIARRNLIAVCRRLGVPVDERPFTLGELFDADEAIVTSSGDLCMGVDEIDGRPVGGKAPALLRRLQDTSVADFRAATE